MNAQFTKVPFLNTHKMFVKSKSNDSVNTEFTDQDVTKPFDPNRKAMILSMRNSQMPVFYTESSIVLIGNSQNLFVQKENKAVNTELTEEAFLH